MFLRRITHERPVALRQAELPFLRRSRRLDRAFKSIIVATTTLAMAGLIFGTRPGRRLAEWVRSSARDRVTSALGLPVDRVEIESRKARERLNGIDVTRQALTQVAREDGPRIREFLRAARIDADSAVIRWGNFDQILALSSAVFEPDDAGRSYRLRPNTRSAWLIKLTIHNVVAMFEIPDSAEAKRLGQAVGGRYIPESVQSTNSWGCRGAEPDVSATARVLVLGDSNMQGVLVGDNQTPPSRLEARLLDELGVPVSVLNTGTLGYSPEQYYHTLLAYHDRFRPNFVIISLCANDFGNMNVPENWAESEYWLDQIVQFCRTRNLDFLAVPLPIEIALLGLRDHSRYPSKFAAIYDGTAANYLDPVEEFATEELARRAAANREGRPSTPSELYNGRYGDHHLSADGSDLWARIVARRIRLVWDATEAIGPRPTRSSHRGQKSTGSKPPS